MNPPKELIRMFVHVFKIERGPRKGEVSRVVGRELTTNATQTTLGALHTLTRKGLITYDDAEDFSRVFGVRAWNVRLTEKGYECLTVTEVVTPVAPACPAESGKAR